MADTAGIPRRRGGVTGLLLILLGAWGALAPFVGPYLHFAYTPDRAWAYTSGRLWLEVVPGVAAALGGLIVLATRSRTAGGLGAFLAALGGAWFVVGTAVTAQFIKSGSISPGKPVGGSASAAGTSLRQFAEGMGFFTGIGVVIVFFAAVALGRFTVAGAESAVQPWDGGLGPADGPEQEQYPTQEQYPAGHDQFSTMAGQYPPGSTQPASAEQATSGPDLFGRPRQQQYPSATGQFPPPSTGEFPASASPFPPPGTTDPGTSQG
jgi:hypothetical protein